MRNVIHIVNQNRNYLFVTDSDNTLVGDDQSPGRTRNCHSASPRTKLNCAECVAIVTFIVATPNRKAAFATRRLNCLEQNTLQWQGYFRLIDENFPQGDRRFGGSHCSFLLTLFQPDFSEQRPFQSWVFSLTEC